MRMTMSEEMILKKGEIYRVWDCPMCGTRDYEHMEDGKKTHWDVIHIHTPQYKWVSHGPREKHKVGLIAIIQYKGIH